MIEVSEHKHRTAISRCLIVVTDAKPYSTEALSDVGSLKGLAHWVNMISAINRLGSSSTTI